MQRTVGLSAVACLLTVTVSSAQVPCQSYRIVEKTVYEQKPVTTYRQETQWVTEEQEVTTYEDVWVTEYETVTSYKPIFETEERYETRIVRKPVWETQTQTSYEDVIEYETVTEDRQEIVLVPKTIRETKFREEQRVERVPVTQTYNQQEAVTTLKPVTTYRAELVDQGGYVDQLAYQPGRVTNRLQWTRPSWNYDPATGANYYQRRGFHWVPNQAPGTYSMQRTYVPNVVAQQVPVTNYVPETVIQQRPVQVTQYVDQVNTYRVPYEEVRTEFEQQIVNQPVTYQRPVTRRIEHQKPVQVLKWIEQEVQVPVKNQTVTYKPIVEQKPVQVLKRIPQVKKVQVQRPVTQWVKQESMQSVPRIVTMRIPLDAYGNPITTPSATVDPAAEVTSEKPNTSDIPAATEEEPADEAPSLTPEQAAEAAEKAENDPPLTEADGSSTADAEEESEGTTPEE
jgi:hypothetical protein